MRQPLFYLPKRTVDGHPLGHARRDGYAYSNTAYDGMRGFSIEYNVVNLSAKIRKGSDSIEYVYSAKGEKLVKKKNGSVVNYYCGNMVYKADLTPEYVIHPEGLALYSGGAYGFQFNLTDHLGNVRTVLNASAAVQQANDYFPFGLTHATVANIAKNKYLYNGKELQNDVLEGIAFDQLDYGALFYDPVIVRWHVVDPLAEQNCGLSPFAYCYNNPLRFVDPDGMRIDDYFDKYGKFLGSDNAQTDYIRIIDNEKLGQLFVDKALVTAVSAAVEIANSLSTGTLDNAVGNAISTAIEETNLSSDAITNIVTHYNDQLSIDSNLETAKLEIKPMPKNIVMLAKRGLTHSVLGVRFGGKESIKINKVDGKIHPILNTGSNITNTLVHERTHIPDNRTSMSVKQREQRAINAQKQHFSYDKTTPEYKRAINNYEKQILKYQY